MGEHAANFFDLFEVDFALDVMDIGASNINETPIYKPLLDEGLCFLTAFDGDERQSQILQDTYGGSRCSIYSDFLFDGGRHEVYFCAPESGMTSLFKPNLKALKFFNNFEDFGKVQAVESVQTTKLDNIQGLRSPDFLKMDVQGAELIILKNGIKTLKDCVAIQLEVSYLPLYENQPTFGEVDVFMRSIGFVPHCFLEVKRWSITPTLFNGNFRKPGNQLLESDIVYIKNPLNINALNNNQLKKMVLFSHFCFKSYDLCVWLLLQLENRKALKTGSHNSYIRQLSKK